MSVDEGFPYEMSDHARRRMTRRGVNLRWIQRTLENPDWTEPDCEDSELTHAVKRFFRSGDSISLRVVYNHTTIPWRVVTVFFDRKTRRAL